MLSSLGFVSSTRPIGARLKILAIGATGGLGWDVVDAAIVGGHKAAALVRDPTRAALPETVEVVRGDVLNPASLTAALDARDAVICALRTPRPPPPQHAARGGHRGSRWRDEPDGGSRASPFLGSVPVGKTRQCSTAG